MKNDDLIAFDENDDGIDGQVFSSAWLGQALVFFA